MLNWIPRRVRLVSAAAEVSTEGKQFNVKLERATGEAIVGEAGAPDSIATELKASAEATVDALRKAIGQVAEVTLRGVTPVAAFGHDLVLVSIKVVHKGQTHRLFGVCPVSENRVLAAAGATLNAANRFLGLG
ncbi:MAG: hypothetical protein HY560_11205 [Gemmatimonadetes bacterium]|nr:hypothetical protein [Gemmatimonadota bacterium]